MAKKKQKRKKKHELPEHVMLRRARTLSISELQHSVDDASMQTARLVRAGQLEAAELYSKALVVIIQELRSRHG